MAPALKQMLRESSLQAWVLNDSKVHMTVDLMGTMGLSNGCFFLPSE